MRKYFKPDGDYDGDNWLVASFGNDAEDGKDYVLTTNFVHASELYQITFGAGGDCELVADLLNWYYNTEEAKKIIKDFSERLE